MVIYFGYFDSREAANKQFADYQGNIRATITANSNAYVQTTDDYPYGLSMATSTGAAANTILYIDPSDETIIAYEGNKRIWFGLRNGGIVVTDDDGNEIDPKSLSNANYNLYEALEELMHSYTASDIISAVICDYRPIYINTYRVDFNGFYPKEMRIDWNASSQEGSICYDFTAGRIVLHGDIYVSLFHEIAHSYDYLSGTFGYNTWLTVKCGDGPYNIKYAELYACAMENRLRGEWNMPMRIGYTHASISGVIFTSSPLPYNYSIKAYINWRHSYNRWGIL